MRTAKRCMMWLLAVGILSMISPTLHWFGSKYGQVEAIADHLGKPIIDGYGILDDKIRIVPAERQYEVDGTVTKMVEFDIYVKDCPDFRGLAVHVTTQGVRTPAPEDFLDINAPNSYGETGMCAQAFSQAPWNCRVQPYKYYGRSVLITNTQQSISITGEQRVCTVAVPVPVSYKQICFGGLKLYTSKEELWDTKGRTYEIGVYDSPDFDTIAFFSFGHDAQGRTLAYCHIKDIEGSKVKSIKGKLTTSRFYALPLDEKDFFGICDGGTVSYTRDGRLAYFTLSFGEEGKVMDSNCLFGMPLSFSEPSCIAGINDIVVEYADGSTVLVADNDNEFCSIKERGRGFVSIKDWTYGQTPGAPTLRSDTNSKEDATVYYKRQSEPDDAYTETVPTQQGDYMIKAVFPANAEYEEVTAVNHFKIMPVSDRQPGSGWIRIEDWTYGESRRIPAYGSDTNQGGNEIVEYRRDDEENFSVAYPKNAGHYTVRVTFPPYGDYDKVVAEDDFTIYKAPSPGNTPDASRKVAYNCAEVGDVSLPQGWSWSWLDGSKPLEVGTPLTVTAIYSGDDQANYENVAMAVTITRQQKNQGVGSVYIAGWMYGEQANTPAVESTTNGTGNVIYYYKKQGEDDTAYTQVRPVNAGQYVIKAVFPETDDYTQAEATAQFTIAKASFAPGRPEPNYDMEYRFDKVSAVTLPPNWEWREQDRDKALSAGVPLTATAVYTGTDKDNYENLTMPVTITRQPERKSEGTVSIAGWVYGEKGNHPTAESDTNGTDHVTYYYKKQGEDDAAYTQTKPVNAGNYVVKAVFPAKDDYEAVEATAEFTIAKAAFAPGLPERNRVVEYPIDRVSKVTLPDHWMWQEEDSGMPLGVRVPYTATAQYNGADKGNYEVESVEVTITRLEQNMPAAGYTVTIVNPTRSHITIHSATAEPIQRHITEAMDPVLFVANAEYYFPENYSIAPVNGIMVRRVSDTRIQVYGTPTANTTIYLVPASRVDAKSHKVTVVNGTGGGSYNSGNQVNIRAEAAPAGMRFAKWRVTQGNIVLVNEKSAATSFTMKTEDVVVVAEYERATGGNGSGNNQDADSVSKAAYEANSRKMNQGIKAAWSGNSLKVDWNLVSGAEGYDIYAAKYTGKQLKRSVTVKDGKAASTKLTKVNGKKPDKKTAYQVKVKAYRYINGTKCYIAESLSVFTAGKSSKKYTDVKSVKPDQKTYRIKKKGTAVIKAKLTKKSSKKKLLPEKYVRQIRYFSTNEKIASVNAKGKVKGKKKGSCYVYLVAGNGAKTRVKIQVK